MNDRTGTTGGWKGWRDLRIQLQAGDFVRERIGWVIYLKKMKGKRTMHKLKCKHEVVKNIKILDVLLLFRTQLRILHLIICFGADKPQLYHKRTGDQVIEMINFNGILTFHLW